MNKQPQGPLWYTPIWAACAFSLSGTFLVLPAVLLHNYASEPAVAMVSTQTKEARVNNSEQIKCRWLLITLNHSLSCPQTVFYVVG